MSDPNRPTVDSAAAESEWNVGEMKTKSKPKHSAVSLIKNLENLGTSDNESADEYFSETFYDELEGLRENLRSDSLIYYEISVTEKVAYWRLEKLIENFIEDCWYKKDLGYICIGKVARTNKAKGKKRSFREMFDETVSGAAVRCAVPPNLSTIRRYVLILQGLPQPARQEFTERALIRKYKEIYNQYVLNEEAGAKSHDEGDWIFFNLYRPKPRTRSSVSEPPSDHSNDSAVLGTAKQLATLPSNTLASTQRLPKADRLDSETAEHTYSGPLKRDSNGLPKDATRYSPTKQAATIASNAAAPAKQQPKVERPTVETTDASKSLRITSSSGNGTADLKAVASSTTSSSNGQKVTLGGANPTKQLVEFLSSFFEPAEQEAKRNPSDSETSDYASLKMPASSTNSSNNNSAMTVTSLGSGVTASSAGSSKSKPSYYSTVQSQTSQSALPTSKWPPRNIEDATKQFSNGVCPNCGVKNLNWAAFYEQGVKNINQAKYVKEHLKEKHKIKV